MLLLKTFEDFELDYYAWKIGQSLDTTYELPNDVVVDFFQGRVTVTYCFDSINFKVLGSIWR